MTLCHFEPCPPLQHYRNSAGAKQCVQIRAGVVTRRRSRDQQCGDLDGVEGRAPAQVLVPRVNPLPGVDDPHDPTRRRLESMTHYFDAVHRLARSGEVLGDTGEAVV